MKTSIPHRGSAVIVRDAVKTACVIAVIAAIASVLALIFAERERGFFVSRGTAAADTAVNREYRRITSSGLKGPPLVSQLTFFAAAAPDHFASQVDLANYYVLAADYEKAAEYLQKAAAAYPKSPDKSEHKRVFHYCTALVSAAAGDYRTALKAADAALALCSGAEEGSYLFLKAAILADSGDSVSAVAAYDTARGSYPSAITEGDIKKAVPLYLAAAAASGTVEDAARFAAAAFDTLDAVYAVGSYAEGFGLWASAVYEKAAFPGLALIAAWLDMDYRAATGVVTSAVIAERLNATESYLTGIGEFQEKLSLPLSPETAASSNPSAVVSWRDDLAIIRVAAGIENAPQNLPALALETPREYHFLRSYALIRARLQTGRIDNGALSELEAMESFFAASPAYYAALWNASATLPPQERRAYIPYLERLISLGPGPALDFQARAWLGSQLDLDSSQSQDLLLLSEAAAVLSVYRNTGNDGDLAPLYALFSLPDNPYVLSALVLAKQNRPLLEDALIRRLKTASTQRLKDRLTFLLQGTFKPPSP